MSAFRMNNMAFATRAQLRAICALMLVALCLAACRSGIQRADAYEATYDRQMNRRAYPIALDAIQKAVRQDENEPRRWLKLAKVQDLMNRPNAAAASYQRALDLQPYNIEALESLAILSVRGGQFDLAKRYIAPLMLLEPNDLAGLLASGAVAVKEKRYADADKFAATIIAGAPDRVEGYILRARTLEASGRPGQATRLLEQRLALDPKNADLPRELMAMYRRQGDRDGIRRTAIRLMAAFPDDPRYALESVRAYHAMKRADEARRVIAALTTRYIGSVPVMTAVAGLWRDIARPDEAADQIVAIATEAPQRVRTAMAELLTANGAPARAAALLAPVAGSAVGADTVDAHAAYARALYGLGRMNDVQREIDQLIAYDKNNPAGLLLRARLALARGDFAKAATDAGVVANDDDMNEEAALLVADIYAAQGNALLAAKAYAAARDNFPDSMRVLRTQTRWLIGQQRAAEAIAIAASYAHAHERRVQGWQVYHDVCAAAGNAECLAEAKRALTGFSS